MSPARANPSGPIIIAVDREGTIIYYNDGARRVLRYSSEEIIGQKVARIYVSLEEARRVVESTAALEAARGYLYNVVSWAYSLAKEGAPLTLATRARLRMAATHGASTTRSPSTHRRVAP